MEGIEEEVEREGRREGGLSQVGGSRIEHASTHTLHSLGTRPLFMLDIIPLSKHTHFSCSLNVCSRAHVGERAGPHDTRGSYSRVYRFSVYGTTILLPTRSRRESTPDRTATYTRDRIKSVIDLRIVNNSDRLRCSPIYVGSNCASGGYAGITAPSLFALTRDIFGTSNLY